jgi:hypothetical protein
MILHAFIHIIQLIYFIISQSSHHIT